MAFYFSPCLISKLCACIKLLRDDVWSSHSYIHTYKRTSYICSISNGNKYLQTSIHTFIHWLIRSFVRSFIHTSHITQTTKYHSKFIYLLAVAEEVFVFLSPHHISQRLNPAHCRFSYFIPFFFIPLSQCSWLIHSTPVARPALLLKLLPDRSLFQYTCYIYILHVFIIMLCVRVSFVYSIYAIFFLLFFSSSNEYKWS